MKQIALLLSIIMLLGICLVMTSCEPNIKTLTPLERAKESVELDFEAEYIASKIVKGDGKTYQSCTFDTTNDLGNNNYEFTGTVTIKDENGRYLRANYTAKVTYDAANDKYNASTNVGAFK